MCLTWVVRVSLWLVSHETHLEDCMNAPFRICDRSPETTSHRPHGRSAGDLAGTPMDSARSLGSPPHPCDMNRQGNRVAELLAIVFLVPQGADSLCPGVHEPLRSAYTEALTNKVGVSWIRAAKPERDQLFNNAVDHTPGDRPSPRLQVVEPLKDAVEPLESDASDGLTPTSSHFSLASGPTDLPASSKPTRLDHFRRGKQPSGRGQSEP